VNDGGRVVVVDDDPTIRRVVRTVLQSAGYQVDEAVDGTEALKLVNGGEPPRVVVLDVMMPGLDGIEVCRRIDTSVTGVLMLTAVDNGPTRHDCEAAGARAFLTKPFSSIELLDVVEGMVRGG
jgi:CheY-like chemotaxis protein